MRISVIGLGKLGAPLAVVLADKGFEVVGADINPDHVAAINAARAPVSESGLQERIDRAHSRLTATTDIVHAVSVTEATFVIVPTPSGPDGTFSNTHVISAVRKIGSALRAKNRRHLVVITSTVMPGATGGPIRQALEEAAGPTAANIDLCYSPEFIALGDVIYNLLNPDFLLIGEMDRRAGDVLENIYRAVCENKPPIHRMSFVNAELTKIAVNTYVTTKISFANMVADICDELPGGDAAVVTAALGSDSRIGAKYLRPGLGYGGPCFPRDNAALAAMARAIGTTADIAEATDRINRRQPARIVGLVRSLLARGTVGILGLSYKPATPVVEDSQGVEIAALLAEAGYRVLVFDPEATEAAISVLGGQVETAASAATCAAAADLLLITTPWPSFRELPRDVLRRANGHRLPIVDCWRLLPDEFGAVADLIYPGRAGTKAEVKPDFAQAASVTPLAPA